MRALQLIRPSELQNQVIIKQLRTSKPLAIYPRRSDPTAKNAKKDKTQSREMQTEDFVKWGIRQGWTDDLIFRYFGDLGLSGTLRPDERPDMLRLFADLESGKLDGGTIACWQENRAFRDETHIYFNQLINLMKQHDVVFIVLSPILYIYDMRDKSDMDRLRDKFEEAANYIPMHVKGWMLPAKERAAWEDDEWAGWGDLPPGFIVDYDPDSPTYKHAIPYEPHMEKVREHFELYRELGGEISLFYQHLRRFPIVFPDFPLGTDRRILSKFKLSKFPGGGYYIKAKSSFIGMLTQPLYIGYRTIKNVVRRDFEGNKIRSFPPVIDEELFFFAYNRLARTDLDGNPIAGNSKKRYFVDKDPEYGLLKFRIASDQGEVRLHAGTSKKGVYRIYAPPKESYLFEHAYYAEVPCSVIDMYVVNRLLERAEELIQRQGDIAAYEAQAQQIRNQRLARINQIAKSIDDIERTQRGNTRNVSKVEAEIEEAKDKQDWKTLAIKEKRLHLLEEDIETLEKERLELVEAKAQLEEELDNDIGSLDEELIKLKTGWSEYNFKKRRTWINFVVQEVRIQRVSTHWIEIIVIWLNEEWGAERMYFRRSYGSIRVWSEEEKAIIGEHYQTMPNLELMALLPERSLYAIRTYAKNNLDIKRGKHTTEHIDLNATYRDLQFMEEHGIPAHVLRTNWKGLY